MSFANDWLRYLESLKGEWISNLVLSGDRPEDMPNTEISIKKEGREVEQYITHREGMEIPDKIGIDPIETKSVEIEIPGGFTFYISKDRKMRIKHVDYSGVGLDVEKENAFVREAKNHGYEVVEITTDA